MRFNVLNISILIAACLLPFLAAAFLYKSPPVQPVPSIAIAGPVPAPSVAAEPPVAVVPFPSFSFVDRNGKRHSIGEYRDKIVILNFWATWCAPCQEEFPRLLALAGSYGDDVVLIALSVDDNHAFVPVFFDQLDETARTNLDRPNVVIGFDPSKRISQTLFQTYKLPETIIAGPHLRMKQKFVGAEWKEEDMKTVIDNLLPR